MNWSSRRSRGGLARAALALVGLLAVASVVPACTPSNKVASGNPLMLSFAIVDPSGAAVDLAPESGQIVVPPLSHFLALFDRLLDPTSLAEIDGEVMEQLGTRTQITSKGGVAVVESSNVSIPADTLYVPNGDARFDGAYSLVFPPGPSITITPTAGLPSGSMVSATLDPTRVRSHDQQTSFQAAGGVNMTLSFQTEPLSASVDVPTAPTDDDGGTGPVPPAASDYVAHVTFNNLTADSTMNAITVTETTGGAAFAGAVVARDDASPGGWTVSPPTGGWPAGAALTITVGAAAADNFMKTLGTAVTASFTVAP